MKIFSFYLTLNLVLAAAVLLLLLAAPLMNRLAFGARLRVHYAALAFALLASLFVTCRPGGEVFEPVVKIWSDPAPKREAPALRAKGVLQVSRRNLPVPADDFFLFFFGIGAGAAAAGLFYLWRGKRKLNEILRGAHVVKKNGRVRILASAQTEIPFSYRSPGTAYVIVPQYLILNPLSLRLAVAHELQHHRQRDTHWAYAFLLARAVCFFNPFLHFWNNWIGEIQEFACDEALVGRLSSRKQAYARCLIEVAEKSSVHIGIPAGAAGMILLSRGNLLNRRIQVMFKNKTALGKYAATAAFALIASGLTGTAFAAKGLVQDRRLTLAQAREMAEKSVPKDSVFPVVVNEEVLKYLNEYIGTPEGRAKMRAALRRMDSYRVMVEAKIAEYNAPPELMAIPIIESGYRNLEDRNVQGWGAGLWMFIASTARNYGLTVDARKDERLNEALLTDAAMRYLAANRARFSDWQLAVLAYNAGENAVQQAIFQTHSRDPWELVRASGLSAEARNYLPKLMAAIVVMKNPSSVE